MQLRIGCCFVLVWLLAACQFSDGETPTPAPERPAEREQIYVSAVGRELLSVTFEEIHFRTDLEDFDVQILLVLADGNGNPSYLLYPSNQPGVPDKTMSFADFPLLINTQAETVGLWVVAFRHAAYPITQVEDITLQLANGFDLLQSQAVVEGSYLASVVPNGDENLLRWFGEVEILGELWLPLLKINAYYEGENEIQSADGGLQVRYRVTMDAKSVTPTAIPTITN